LLEQAKEGLLREPFNTSPPLEDEELLLIDCSRVRSDMEMEKLTKTKKTLYNRFGIKNNSSAANLKPKGSAKGLQTI
jgi:hypothetical protein